MTKRRALPAIGHGIGIGDNIDRATLVQRSTLRLMKQIIVQIERTGKKMDVSNWGRSLSRVGRTAAS